jgi:RNA polymerase sigma-70 factor (ECF subfamily)
MTNRLGKMAVCFHSSHDAAPTRKKFRRFTAVVRLTLGKVSQTTLRMSIEPLQPSDPAEDAEELRYRSRIALVERLFREHNEALVRFLRARLHSQQEALEVAQDAYVRLLSLDEPGAVSYLRAFLFRTAENLAVDRMRRVRMHERASESTLFREFADSRTPERQTAATQTLQRLEKVIAAMPWKCRRAFVMRRLEGKDVGVIAAELGLSERRVREYIADALLRCREFLDTHSWSTYADTDD